MLTNIHITQLLIPCFFKLAVRFCYDGNKTSDNQGGPVTQNQPVIINAQQQGNEGSWYLLQPLQDKKQIGIPEGNNYEGHSKKVRR